MDSMVVQRSSPSSNGGLNAIRAMIMVLVMVVFVGYLLLWLMTPTSVYRQKWLPQIRADANSTFFGAQASPKITPQSAAKQGEKVWEAKLDSAALRLGLVGNLCLAFLFFPVTRGSSVLPLFGLTSEASVKYHIWLGHIVMTLFTAHGLCYIIYWAVTHQLLEVALLYEKKLVRKSGVDAEMDKTGVSNVAGELALLAGLAMWVTTFPRIRRKMFEIFFYTHYLYILFIVFFIFHVGISYSCMMLPARVLTCEVMELNFSKTRGLSYTPTSIMFMNVPGISKLQWHPFTISSSSNLEPEKLSVIIKSEGSWSKKLYQMLSSPSSVDHLNVSIEGPYGPASTNFLRHDTLVMVSGGSGITPFISIIRDLIFTSETVKCKTPQILLICAFKNTTDLTMLDLLLPISSTQNGFSNLHLQIEAYVTRDKEPKRETKMPLQTIWFKPNSSDSPISPILGPNSWIWLGAIISSSLIIFLLFMGILTRYYIYPIDHNTNQEVYSYSSRAVLNILLICISIAVTASAAFYWNKKQGARETNQVQNMEGTTPVASPSSWVYNADREMESFPQQSLVQSTNVHYGERPDLKRILFERKESSIGVLVCGPKKMRHEVASICSAGLAENLHFESISFSW
ncbi:ferric reduction oxidase 2 [Actinidia rufa]|uniref:ferric-chelate reductase (NADH) n=1 Tax=Actinidia rufa TaxID=165716 RepID=A0A7J0H1F3_9ERIC|nr:ferric reduction oxidase 2 [Actinidia rufa]